MVSPLRKTAHIAAWLLLTALSACAQNPIWFNGREYSSPGSLFTGGDKPAPVPTTSHRAVRTTHHTTKWDLREYREANLTLDHAYRKLSNQMDLQQQLALSQEQTVWLNEQEAACTLHGVTSVTCEARRSYARAAVLSARHVPPTEALVTQTPLPQPGLPAGSGQTAPPLAQTYFVPVTAMPWIWQPGGKNQAYSFGYPNGTAPVVVPLGALGAQPGTTVNIQYDGGEITIGDGGPRANATGYMGLSVGAGPLGAYPSKYVPGGPVNLGALVAVFTDDAGNILSTPFAVGAGRKAKAVPPGASRLQFGINDDVFGGNSPATHNSGGFSVRVFRAPL